KTIKGRVVDSQTQEPLIGATVKIAGTTEGVVTNTKGNFTLEVSQAEVTLEVGYISYESVTVPIRNNTSLNISLKPNNLYLNEVVVTGFANEKRLQEVAGSVGLITEKELQRANTISLQPVLNTIPGVRVDQSNLSDTRISIRGVGVRSAFGNRNLKFYVNDIPLTEADGFTRIEGLDVATLGRVEVIKGPASSIYGFGTGGVLNFQVQKSAYGEQSLSTDALVGDYGLARLSSTYKVGNDKMNIAATYGWQQLDGYRDYSSDVRRFLTTSLQFYPSDQQTVSAFINRTTQLSEIPGFINQQQVEEDRRQADPRNLEQQAARDQTWTRIGISHDYQFTESFRNVSSLFTSFYELDHPLAFAYLRTGYQSYGGRTRFVFEPNMSRFKTRFTVGGEYLNGISRQLRYVNNEGEEGDIILNADQNNTQYSLFYQSETSLTDQWLLTLGISYNRIEYDVLDYLQPERTDVRAFDPEWTPRAALSYLVSENHALHASVSYGFAPPTVTEARNVDGSLNTALRPETGVNYELNAKGTFLNKRLNYQAAIFRFDVSDELIPQSVEQNVTIYNNAGRTSRNGVELGLSYDWVVEESGFIETIKPFVTVAYSDFQFEEYQILNADDEVTADFAGNALTGVMPWVVNVGLDIYTRPGFYFNT
ncbi:MAG: TonB-dependent receptor, partial [Bacteroidota bacterium]